MQEENQLNEIDKATERARKQVEKEGIFSANELNNINQELESKVETAVADADKAPEPEHFELFTDVYKDYPLELLKRGYKI